MLYCLAIRCRSKLRNRWNKKLESQIYLQDHQRHLQDLQNHLQDLQNHLQDLKKLKKS